MATALELDTVSEVPREHLRADVGEVAVARALLECVDCWPRVETDDDVAPARATTRGRRPPLDAPTGPSGGQETFQVWAKHHSKLGGRSAAVLTGWQYAVRASLAPLLLRLPVGVRPAGLNHEVVPLLRFHARNAWHGVHGPAIAELAAEWNERLRVSGED